LLGVSVAVEDSDVSPAVLALVPGKELESLISVLLARTTVVRDPPVVVSEIFTVLRLTVDEFGCFVKFNDDWLLLADSIDFGSSIVSSNFSSGCCNLCCVTIASAVIFSLTS
jgi:hypothetical protein